MIDQALTLIATRLNGHLAAQFSVPEDLVAIAPLTDPEGKPAALARNRLVMFVSNIAHDPMPRQGAKHAPSAAGQVARAAPIHLDIYFMLAAAFDADTYGEGLKLLSAGVRYFQAHPLMTRQNTPEMPRGLAQLALEISNLRSDELGQIWGNLGGRYVPSVHYKMRSVMIDSDAVIAVEPLVRRPGSPAVAPT